MSEQPCEHKFIHLGTAKFIVERGPYQTKFKRIDTFFCERCLEQREIVKEEWSRDEPHWYRG